MSIKKILLAVIIVGGVLAGGFWFWQSKKTAVPSLEGDQSLGVIPPAQPARIIPPAPGLPGDQDSDGLPDKDEIEKYKTDPKNSDTDGDGLSDKVEIEIYKTDPLKADTDGDKHRDGIEILNGFNPLGAGRQPTSTKSKQ